MAVPDGKPSSSITTPHFFAHIYVSHASKIIEEYVATDRKDQISRAKIEFDIIRVMDEDPNLPLKHRVSCTSMILHTDTFEPFWGDQRLAYTLSEKSVKRFKPNYKLIDQIPCPSADDDATALSSSLGNLTDQNVNSRNQPTTTTAKNKGKGGRGRAATAKTNGRAPKKATTTAAANRKRATVAQKAPKTAKSGAGNGKSNANSNANATANGVTAASTTVPATLPQRTGRPLGKTPQEAYAECMAQKDDLHIRGPTSDEEETTTDDDSDSD